MLDWIFEGIVTWISSVVSDMMDTVSGLFLQALGTDMTAMEEYFPFVSKAFTVCLHQRTAAVWHLQNRGNSIPDGLHLFGNQGVDSHGQRFQ